MQEFESSVIMSKIIVTIWVFLLFSCHHNENLDNLLKKIFHKRLCSGG